MRIQPLSRIVTDFFLVLIPERKTRPQIFGIEVEAGMRLLSSYLLRASAQKIYISSNVPASFPNVEEIVRQYPAGLASRIEIVDKDGKIFNRVRRFLQPIYDEISSTQHEKESGYPLAFDFLYKLAIASQFQAEADIHTLARMGYHIDRLKRIVKDDEAKFRLDEIYGIYYLYQKPEEIDTLTMLPDVRETAVHQRVLDLLDEAEFMELSRQRYLLGLPSKARIAMMKIRKRIKEILVDKKYSQKIAATQDMIHLLSSYTGYQIPLPNVSEILASFNVYSYNPPLVDLDYFRFSIAKKWHDRIMGILLPLHPDGAVHMITDRGFRDLASKHKSTYSK